MTRRGAEPNPPAPFPRREGGATTRSAGDSVQRRALGALAPPSLLGKGAGGLGPSSALANAAARGDNALMAIQLLKARGALNEAADAEEAAARALRDEPAPDIP